MSAFASNIATGCTMVFNKCLLKALLSQIPNHLIMHDYWVYVVCLSLRGEIIYDQNPYILYRQHANNVIGGLKIPFIKKWSLRFFKIFSKGNRYKSRMAKELLDCYGTKIMNDDKDFLKLVSSCNKWSSRIKLLIKWKLKGLSFDKKLQLYGLVITGKL